LVKVLVNLCILARDCNPDKKGEYTVLLHKVDSDYFLPNKELSFVEEVKQPLEIAQSMLEDLTKVSSRWATVTSGGYAEANDKYFPTLELLYGVYLPGPTRLLDGEYEWVDLKRVLEGEFLSQSHKDMINHYIFKSNK